MKAVLFDLDGTLLPMDYDLFIKYYFGSLAKKFAPLGYDAEKLINAVWHGTEAMGKNDGSTTNEEVFWKTFASDLGERVLKDKVVFEDFYANEFQNIEKLCSVNQKADELVKSLKNKGYKVVLATNPLFPDIATSSRIRWANLEKKDFDLYTTYENSSFSKPNLAYYEDIATKIGVAPEDCLMVGNDVDEDMVAKKCGMEVFLVTDCLLNKHNLDINEFPHGTFDDLIEYLKTK